MYEVRWKRVLIALGIVLILIFRSCSCAPEKTEVGTDKKTYVSIDHALTQNPLTSRLGIGGPNDRFL